MLREVGTFPSRFSAVSVLCRSIVGPISFLFDTPSLKKYSFYLRGTIGFDEF